MTRTAAFLCCLLACAAPLYAQPAGPPAAPGAGPGAAPRAPRYVDPAPYNFDDHTGWTSVFDGSTLKGWEGPADEWRVEDGAIVSSSTANGSPVIGWATVTLRLRMPARSSSTDKALRQGAGARPFSAGRPSRSVELRRDDCAAKR